MKNHLLSAASLLLAISLISACNAPWLTSQAPPEAPAEKAALEPTALPPTITLDQDAEPVELDPCTLLDEQLVGEFLGGEVQVMPALGTGGCSYTVQGQSPAETSQLIVSAAQGEEAKSLTLLSLGMLAGFSGDPSLQSEFEAINQDAPSLDLIELIELLGNLLRETNIETDLQVDENTATLWIVYESEAYNQGTFILARQDTYLSLNQVGSMPLLEKEKLASAAEDAFNQLPANFYLLDANSDGSIQIQIGEETALPDATATQEEELKGKIWVGTGNSAQVIVIDPQSNDILATIDAGRFTSDIAIERDQIWVINEIGGVIRRFDPETYSNVDQKNIQKNVLRADIKDGVLWISGEIGIKQLDLDEGVFRDVVYNRCYDIVVGDAAVWSSQSQDQQILKIDPDSRDVTATIKFDGQPADLAYGDGMLWVVLYDRNEIVGVDPLTDTVVSTYSAPSVIHSITYHEGKLWYTNPTSIHYIDLETMEQGSFAASHNPYRIEIFDGSIWVTSPNQNAIVRFNLETFKTEAVIEVEGDPRVIKAGGYN
ncbi:MAG: hypothetical protein PVI81_07565 [Anaerolineales bacterium]|jgi:streptogramin lyase